jgi:mono/diheme cytochrome c family protein
MASLLGRWIPRVLIAGLVVFLAIQLVPYGRDHDNPEPDVDPVAWPTTEAANAFDVACADCHSNRTEWPWYSNVAPISWLVTRDVEQGRDSWNVSMGDGPDEADDAIELIESGDMPPSRYLPLHPDARLSDQEQAELVAALRQLEEGEDEQDEAEDRADDAADEAEGRADE